MKSLYQLLLIFIFAQLSFSQNTWTYIGNYGGAIKPGTSSFVINSKVYYFHSITNGALLTNDVWEYDPTNNLWTQKANYPGTNVDLSLAFSLNNIGYTGTGATPFSTNEFFSYNPTNNTWIQLNNVSGGARQRGIGFSVNGKAYLGLGNINSKEIWEYNDLNDTWTRKNDFPGTQSDYLCSFVVNNIAYLMGGDGYSAELWMYDDINDTWTRKADYPSNARTPGAFAIDNKGYAIGGSNGSGFIYDLWMYNPLNDTWTQKLTYNGINTERFSIGVVSGYAYLVPIWFGGGPLNAFYKYTPSVAPTIGNINDATNISYFSATCNALISSDGNDTITSRGIVYSTHSHPTLIDNSISTSGSLGSFSINLSNLISSTKYYVRAYATNAFGTSYGTEINFTTLRSSEDDAPNNGDGNGDGIQDSDQSAVYSILNTYTNKYITIESLDGYTITGAEVQFPNDNINYYPASLVKFTVNASTASIKLYYHNVNSLNGYTFRKLNSQNTLFNFSNYTFGSEEIGDNTVATALLTLTDGGPEDYDGVVNGSITDPGGPAILASNANIPVWDWRYLSLLFVLFALSTRNRLI
jgi:hypothetical protein